MRIYPGLSELPMPRRPTAVTIGNFDGVHRGHRALIGRLLARARATAGVPTVLTFDPHPRQVLQGSAPAPLVTPERKMALLDDAGVEQVIVMSFDRRLSLMEPEQFIDRILVGELQAKAIVVGSNFRFGRFARGEVAMLRSFGRKLGYVFQSVRLAELEGRHLSSTQIRHALQDGDITWATKALGRPYSIPGVVVKASGRGHAMGFPTANLEPVMGICLPKLGIYAGNLAIGEARLPSAISIGTNPTFGDNPVSVEAHVLDFDADLYGLEAAVELVARIRDEMAFESPGSLARAIEEDVSVARRILSRSAAPR